MRDEYTALIEEQGRVSQEFEQQRKRYQELEARRAQVERELHVLRERVVSAQGEQCAYCGAHLRSNRSYQLQRDEWEGLIDDAELDARRAQNPIPYERRVKYQIRLKVPKSRGGCEALENLVACCTTCGPKKHNKTHDEFMSLIEGRARAAVPQKIPLRLVPSPGAGPP
jgi:5-methylcytosine-specific restriction endonuclease McrA